MKQLLLFWFCIIYSILGGQNSFIKFYEFNNIIFHFHDVAVVGWDTLITPERQTFFNAKMDKPGNFFPGWRPQNPHLPGSRSRR